MSGIRSFGGDIKRRHHQTCTVATRGRLTGARSQRPSAGRQHGVSGGAVWCPAPHSPTAAPHPTPQQKTRWCMSVVNHTRPQLQRLTSGGDMTGRRDADQKHSLPSSPARPGPARPPVTQSFAHARLATLQSRRVRKLPGADRTATFVVMDKKLSCRCENTLRVIYDIVITTYLYK